MYSVIDWGLEGGSRSPLKPNFGFAWQDKCFRANLKRLSGHIIAPADYTWFMNHIPVTGQTSFNHNAPNNIATSYTFSQYTIGSKKLAKVDLCFSSNKLTKWYLLHFLSWSWPIFCTEKNWMTLVQNIWPKSQQMYKNVEVGLIRGRSFVGWKYRPCREKKLKIAMLNEADFMVKLRFESWNWCFANICAPVTWVKYLKEFWENVCFQLFDFWLQSPISHQPHFVLSSHQLHNLQFNWNWQCNPPEYLTEVIVRWEYHWGRSLRASLSG